MKILIVDDDIFRRTSLKDYFISTRLLEDQNIYVASNADEATGLLTRFHFDVLVLDVVLPKDGNRLTKADSKTGLDLLTNIARKSSLKKPTKIIGITAHLADQGRFQRSFQKHCLVVIEANRRTTGWKQRLADYIGYDHQARTHREIEAQSLNVITLHGIRTYGHWQSRLRELVHFNIMTIPFHTYKYGYASFLALFSSSHHKKEIRLLSNQLNRIFDKNINSTFIVFCHSFGTYLLTETLRELASIRSSLPIRTVVLAGSVLPSTVDLDFLRQKNIRVINDCAERDYVLWLSEAFVPNLGMAGKTGIYGVEDEFLLNRFSRGGHSSYFEGDEYMLRNWVPLIGGVEEPARFDFRESTALEQDFLERIVVFVGSCKASLIGRARRLKNRLGFRNAPARLD